MDQDATWHGGRPRPRRHFVRWEPTSPTKKGEAHSSFPTFRPMYCGQTSGWTKMALGTQIGLGPGHIVLDGDPAPPKWHSPHFSAHVCCGQTAGWTKMPLNWYRGRPRSRRQCVRWETQLPLEKGTAHTFSPCLLWRNGWIIQDGTWYESRPRPRPRCLRWGPSSPPPKKRGHSPLCFRPVFIVAKRSPISVTASRQRVFGHA